VAYLRRTNLEATNQIRMKILKDGTISTSTDAFTEEVHQQADQLIKETITLLGGETKVVERKDPSFANHNHHHGGQSHSH
jgi:hypothetical protein